MDSKSSSATPVYNAVDISMFRYSSMPFINQNTGSKSIALSVNGVEPNATGAPNHESKLRFQLGSYESGEFCRAPYGVSSPYLNGPDNGKRNLDLSVETDDMLAFLRSIDAKNKDAACAHTQEWFKNKNLTPDNLSAFYTALIKESSKPEYRPTVRTKFVMEGERNATQVFVVKAESPPNEDGSPGKILEFDVGSIVDVTRGCKCIPIVESNGMWVNGMNSFGLTLTITHLLVWPMRRARGIEAFALANMPSRAEGQGNGAAACPFGNNNDYHEGMDY